MKKITLIVLIIFSTVLFAKYLLIDSFPSTLILESKGIEFDEILYETKIDTLNLIIYNTTFSKKEKGIGLTITQKKDFFDFIVIGNSRSFSQVVTWDTIGTRIGDERINIIYGSVEPEVTKLQFKINNILYEPELIKTEYETIWYIPIYGEYEMQFLKGYNFYGEVVYLFPPHN